MFPPSALRGPQKWPGTKIRYPTGGYRKISSNKDVLLKIIVPYFCEKKKFSDMLYMLTDIIITFYKLFPYILNLLCTA